MKRLWAFLNKVADAIAAPVADAAYGEARRNLDECDRILASLRREA